MNLRFPKALLALALACVAVDASSAVLYKLTDRSGRITYADVVPRGFEGTVQRIDVDTGGPALDVPKAPPTAVLGPTEIERILTRRPDTRSEDRVRAARARVEAARRALEEAQASSTPDDWIYFGPGNPLGMRRAPRPEYQARLERLEGQLRLAEEQLRLAERG